VLRLILSTPIVFFLISCEVEKYREIIDLTDLFTKKKVISLNTEGYLSVRFVEVNKEGELLVTGRRGEVLLFNGSGELIQDLGEGAMAEYPGLNWSPNRAIFLKDGSIFVQNNAPWGIFFDKSGQFKGITSSDFHISNRFTSGFGNNFFSMEITPEGAYIRKLDINGNEINRFDEVPENFINLMQRYRVGNQFVSDDRYLFFITVAEPALYRLDLGEWELNRFEQPPGYVNQATSDISSLQQVGTAGLAEEIAAFAENNTVSYSLHSITDQLLIIQYQNRSAILEGKAGFGLQLVTRGGQFPMESDLMTDEWVLAAVNGNIYTMVRQDDAYRSPTLNVYQLDELF
jgi:hypothetical protein